MNKSSKGLLLTGLLAMGTALPALAALQEGALAPEFTAQASMKGKPFTYSLEGRAEEGPGRGLFLSVGLHQWLQRSSAHLRRQPGEVCRGRRHASLASRSTASSGSTISRRTRSSALENSPPPRMRTGRSRALTSYRCVKAGRAVKDSPRPGHRSWLRRAHHFHRDS